LIYARDQNTAANSKSPKHLPHVLASYLKQVPAHLLHNIHF